MSPDLAAAAFDTAAPRVAVAGTALPALRCRYLLAIHVPVVVDAAGRRWTERLWAVDLERHTDYIANLTVACPFVRGEPPADTVELPSRAGLRFEPVPWRHGALAALLRAPLTVARLWRLVGRADVVHSIYGGWWPFATPYLLAAVTRLRGRWLMINIESSPWRVARGATASAWRRFQARSAEALNRRALSLADIAFFTHEGYRRDLLPTRPERGHVIHASWIDEAAVLDRRAAVARWQARAAELAEPGPPALRLLLAGRLEADKGVAVLLEAVRRLRADPASPRLAVGIVGRGPLLERCRAEAAASDDRVRLEVLEPVPYGEPLFALLRRFDALVVPSLADEQPRVVYDAYSQALPVLASATPGLSACVEEGVTGRLFAPADAAALAGAIRAAAADPADLERQGLAALEAARAMTHQQMHRRRHALIAEALAARGTGARGA